MSKDRGPLGEIADRVRKDTSAPVFPYRGSLPTEEEIFWDGEDVGQFLAFAKQANARVVYLNENVVEEGEEDPIYSEHIGETSSVSVSFLVDGVFHSFFEVAPWVPEESEGGSEAGQEKPELTRPLGQSELPKTDLLKLEEALRLRSTELIDEFIARVERGGNPPPDPDSEWDVRHEFLSFLAESLDLPSLRSGSTYFELGPDSGAGRALRDPIHEISKQIRAAERVAIDRATAGCEEWVARREIPLRSLNVERVREYAEENDLRFSRSGLRELRDRVTALIKRKRPGGPHHS